jgi:xanthine/CO dehydrogenase XdhC/CoxF family maturation factor
MTERSIVEAAARLRRQREPYLIATVVAVRGSAYRRPGARMLLTQFRWIAGSVSGGCLEGDISNKGWWRTRGGEPVVVTYDSRLPESADDDDVRAAFGLGCDGVVEVFLERAGAAGTVDPLELAHECIRAQRRAAIVTVFRGAGNVAIGTRLVLRAGTESCSEAIGDRQLRAEMIADARAAIETGESRSRTYQTADGPIEAFVEAIVPPPRLFVFGTGHDAVPMVQLARLLGWETFVIAPKPRVATRERFVHADEVVTAPPAELAGRIDAADRAVAIVMGHHYALDREHVSLLAGTCARYIGVLGPRARTARILGELGLPSDDARIHAPLGLDVGAETPQEIALAAISEIQAALRHAPATSLRERAGGIHR